MSDFKFTQTPIDEMLCKSFDLFAAIAEQLVRFAVAQADMTLDACSRAVAFWTPLASDDAAAAHDAETPEAGDEITQAAA